MTENLQLLNLHFTAGLNIHKLKQYSYIAVYVWLSPCLGSPAMGHGSPCHDPCVTHPKSDPFDPLTYDPSTHCLLWLLLLIIITTTIFIVLPSTAPAICEWCYLVRKLRYSSIAHSLVNKIFTSSLCWNEEQSFYSAWHKFVLSATIKVNDETM